MGRIADFMSYQLNEANTPESKVALINVFFEALNKAVESTDEGYTSYSNLAFDHMQRANSDPEKDFNKIMKNLASEGWKKEAVVNLFNRYGDTISKIYDINAKDYSYGYGESIGVTEHLAECGQIDMFLFKMTHGKVALSGYDYKDSAEGNGSQEYFIKYGYGYHRTKYGQLAISQFFGSIEKWFEFGEGILLKALFGRSEYGTEDNVYEFLQKNNETPEKFMKMVTMKKEEHHTVVLEMAKVKAYMDKNYDAVGYGELLKAIRDQLSSLGFWIQGDDKKYIKGGKAEILENGDIKVMFDTAK